MVIIKEIDGVQLSSSSSNSRYGKREDCVVVKLEKEAKISGKFTNNAFQAAPVKIAKKHLKSRKKEELILIINAGNANAGNGKLGEEDALICCRKISKYVGINYENIIPFSTGVIGEHLDTGSCIRAFKSAFDSLGTSNWEKSSKAILTTDTRPKLVSKEINLGKKVINITGFAKGSGMIRPDFATLLSFVFTDAKLNQSVLNKVHSQVLAESFEKITVDGDTSPNDASVLVATGKSSVVIKSDSKEEKVLTKKLTEIYQELAAQIVRDAEGAKKEIEIQVSKAKTQGMAKTVAFTVAHSPLVKTALSGSDANWGRILAAVGRVKEISDISKVSITLNGVSLVRSGSKDPNYNESLASTAVKAKKIAIKIILNQGKEKFSVLTSDLSEDYVLINSDYRS